MPTFRNILFYFHRQVGVKNELGLRNVGVLYEKRFGSKIAEPIARRVTVSPSFLHQHFSNLVHSSHLPAYKDGTECSETSAYEIQTPENYPEESILLICY